MADSQLHELFKLAMWDEHISHSLYLATAGKAKDRMLKNKLLYLAGDEKAHLEELREMHRVLCCPEEIELTKVGYSNPAETGFMKPEAEPDIKAFLTYAMEKESSALNFYLNMSDHLSADPKASIALLHFSAMEGDHYNLLKTELENLKRRTA
ncbi:MAG: ferritin family protein [Thermoplasmata archaeon]